MEGREEFEGIIIPRRWSCLQAWDAALLKQVKGKVPVKDKGQSREAEGAE